MLRNKRQIDTNNLSNGLVSVIEVGSLGEVERSRFGWDWLCQYQDGSYKGFETEVDACAYQRFHLLALNNGYETVEGLVVNELGGLDVADVCIKGFFGDSVMSIKEFESLCNLWFQLNLLPEGTGIIVNDEPYEVSFLHNVQGITNIFDAVMVTGRRCAESNSLGLEDVDHIIQLFNDGEYSLVDTIREEYERLEIRSFDKHNLSVLSAYGLIEEG